MNKSFIKQAKEQAMAIQPTAVYTAKEAAALLRMDPRVFKEFLDEKLKREEINILRLKNKSFRIVGQELLKIANYVYVSTELRLEGVTEDEVIKLLEKFLAGKGLSITSKKLSKNRRLEIIEPKKKTFIV